MAESSKREQWSERIAAWGRSGLSRRAWCDKHGINVHTLDYWRRRLGGESGVGKRKRQGKLVPIVVSATAAPMPFDVLLPAGVQLRVPAGADVAQVAQLVRALCAC
jgi:transposase-like protein